MKTRHVRFRLRTPDGTLLAVSQLWPAKSPYVVVFAGSLSGTLTSESVQSALAEALAEHWIGSLRFDYREHGDSDAGRHPFSPLSALEDLSTVIAYAQSKKPQYVGILGSSFGGSVAALYAGKNPQSISALCLHNPVLDFDSAYLHPTAPWATTQFGGWKEELDRHKAVILGHSKLRLRLPFFLESQQLHPVSELQPYLKPLLVLHGTADSKVSLFDTKRAFDLLGNRQKQFIAVDNAEHGFFEEPHRQRVLHSSVEFFRNSWNTQF